MFGYYKFRRKLREFFLIKKARRTAVDFIKSGEELLLIANGYTLNDKIDLSTLKGNDIFVCNELYLHQDYDNLIKSNNVLHFAMDGIESYLYILPKMENLTVDQVFEKYLYPILASKVNVTMPLNLYPYITKNFPYASYIASQVLKEKLIKAAMISSKSMKNLNGGHTPHFMILAGILMGYKKIHLYGLEHNYVKDILNKDPKCGTHFYNESYRQVLELNIGKDLPREAYRTTLSSLFESNACTFRVYEALAELAKERGTEIIDHSGGSLFMFQDYSLWDLVELPSPKQGK
jgi:hypothetical protein